MNALVVYAEDAGAAAFLAPLARAAAERGWKCRLIAHGTAMDQLRGLGVAFEAAPPTMGLEDADIIVVGTCENPHSAGFDLIAHGRALGVPTVGVVDSPTSLEHRFRGDSAQPLGKAPDWIVVATSAARQVYERLGHRADRIVVCGHPHHDVVRRELARLSAHDRGLMRRRLFAGLADDVPVVTFLAELSDGLDPSQFLRRPDYSLSGRGSSIRRTDIVLEEVLDALKQFDPRPYFVLRHSPKNEEGEFDTYKDEVDLFSRGGSPLELLYCSDVVVGMTTTVIQESILLQRPTLSVVPREAEKAWLPEGTQNLIPCVAHSGDLQAALKRLITDGLHPDEDSIGRVYPANAVERLMELLSKICDEEKPRYRIGLRSRPSA